MDLARFRLNFSEQEQTLIMFIYQEHVAVSKRGRAKMLLFPENRLKYQMVAMRTSVTFAHCYKY